MPRDLDTDRRSSFFTWFGLAPVGAPVAVGGAGAWSCFRPTGAAFHALAEIDIRARAPGTIDAACLGLDRAFIDDRRNSPFARDIAKSFLAWAVPDPSPRLSALIANIADFGGSGAVIIMRAPGPAPPPPDTTGAYDAFLGRRERARLDPEAVTLTNVPGRMPQRVFDAPAAEAAAQGGSGWLRIDVRLASGRRASVFGRRRRWVGVGFIRAPPAG
jgi:hypothetical protein